MKIDLSDKTALVSVVYILSKEASATNGAALRVEGGVLSSIA